MQVNNQFGIDPGIRGHWVRRRYVVEGGLIQPVPRSQIREYDPHNPAYEWDKEAWERDRARGALHDGGRRAERNDLFPRADRQSISLTTNMANLDPGNRRAVEEFTERWGLLGLAVHDGREVRGEEWDSMSEMLDQFAAAVGDFRHAVRLYAECEASGSAEAARQLARSLDPNVRHVYPRPMPLEIMTEPETGQECPGVRLLEWSVLWAFPSLLAAAYWQLSSYLQGVYGPRECANPTCRRWFIPIRADRRYCSSRCSNVVLQRERRAAAKQRQESDEGGAE